MSSGLGMAMDGQGPAGFARWAPSIMAAAGGLGVDSKPPSTPNGQLLSTRAHTFLHACLQGEVQRQKWYYMPIKYTTARAECTAWTTKPTYFLQVRYR